MPLNKNQLRRLKLIHDSIVRSRPGLNTSALMEILIVNGLEVSKSAIEKDISVLKTDELLRSYFDIKPTTELKFDAVENRYKYVIDEKETTTTAKLSPDDQRFLIQLKSLLPDEHFSKKFDQLLKKLLKTDIMSSYFEMESIHQSYNKFIFEELVEVIQNCEVIDLFYENKRKKEIKHAIYPMYLKEADNRWYLISWRPNEQRPGYFALDGILNIKRLGQKIPEDFEIDLKQDFKHVYGMNTDGEGSQKVMLAFDISEKYYLERLPLHPTQKLEYESEKKYVVSLDIRISNNPENRFELEGMILGYGPLVRVLSPPVLVESIKEKINKTKNIYNDRK